MSESPAFSLHSVSVVVTAQFHNPSILNPDFLVSRQIVPEGWAVAETLTTPPVSVVKYENGISQVHQLAVEYLRKPPSRALSEPWTQLSSIRASVESPALADRTVWGELAERGTGLAWNDAEVRVGRRRCRVPHQRR